MDQQIKEFVIRSNLLPNSQSGFRSGCSCTTALLCVTDDILRATDAGLVTVLVLLDYSKAFDTVSHPALLSVLKSKHFSRNSLNMIADFLSNRTQSVKIKTKISKPLPVRQGVPQGAILSPILFNLYTSSLAHCLTYSKIHMYADDVQLYYSFDPSEWVAANDRINKDLFAIQTISDHLSLHINPIKSQTLIFGSKDIATTLSRVMHVRINNAEIPFTISAKSLGLTLDNTFRFRDHITNNIRAAYLNLKTLYPYRSLLDVSTKKSLCDAYVLARFAYCSEVYNDSIDVLTSNRIQKVQNACLRFIHGIRKFDHVSHKLADTGWLNMRNRRELQTLTLYHKILTDKCPPYLYCRIRFRTDIHNLTTRFRGLISPPPHRLTLFERSFSYGIYKKYNNLQLELKVCTVSQFRYKLRGVLMTVQAAG